MRDDQPLDVGVLGTGSMGENHARVYESLSSTNLVGVYDVDEAAADEVADRYGTRFFEVDTLLERAHAVSIVVPTEYHYETAKRAMERGVCVLVEKPICKRPERGEDLVAIADEHDVTLQVGHIERFNPAVRTAWKVIDDCDVIAIDTNRLGPPIARDISDSAVVDLMIHDLDIVLSVLGEMPIDVQATGTKGNAYATATLTFPSGVVASLTASRVTQRKVRTLDITAEDRLVSADFLDRGVEIHRHSLPEFIQENGDVRYRHESVVEYPTVERGEPLQGELDSFVEAVRTDSEPEVTGSDGVRALRLARRIELLAADHQEGGGA